MPANPDYSRTGGNWATPVFLVLAAVLAPCLAQADDGDGLDALVQLIEHTSKDQVRLDLLQGILRGLEGRRSVRMPSAWPAAYARLQHSRDAAVRDRALQLALVFDDPVALSTLRRRVVDPDAPAAARNAALEALLAKRPASLAALLLELVSDPVLQNTALRGLAGYDHPETAQTLLECYPDFDSTARRNAVQTLASRPAWAEQLLDAVESERIAKADLTAYTARQLRNLGDARLTARARALWGEVRSTPAEKLSLIEDYKRRLTPESLERADRSAGRALYQELCANCHRLFGSGGNIGPEITGAQRANLDYILENLVDPSATVARAYQMRIIQTTRGRIITGLIVAENEAAVTIQTANEKLVVPVREIESRTVSTASMMPEGMLSKLSTRQLRDLIAYLGSPHQVPLPAANTAGGSSQD